MLDERRALVGGRAAEGRTLSSLPKYMLGVSRPYLVGLIDKGELPARKVGPRRRLVIADVLAYRAETKAKRREAQRELSALDQELGLR